MKLTIYTIKARDGRDYVQIISDDQKTINIVLIAEEISIVNNRKEA